MRTHMHTNPPSHFSFKNQKEERSDLPSWQLPLGSVTIYWFTITNMITITKSPLCVHVCVHTLPHFWKICTRMCQHMSETLFFTGQKFLHFLHHSLRPSNKQLRSIAYLFYNSINNKTTFLFSQFLCEKQHSITTITVTLSSPPQQ